MQKHLHRVLLLIIFLASSFAVGCGSEPDGPVTPNVGKQQPTSAAPREREPVLPEEGP